MSRATAEIMRRALQFCHRGFLLKHHLTPAVGSFKLYSVHGQHLPRTVFYFHFRHFSDAQTFSRQPESEKQSLVAEATSPNVPITKTIPVFLDKLALCSSPSDVLDLTSCFAPTPAQLSHCLSRMWNSLKKLSDEQRRIELQLMWDHPGWEPLLQRTVGGVTHLPNMHLAYCLLALEKLGVSPRTRVVQTYLRAAQERLNDFDDKSLSILSSCLETMADGANVRALKHGIRLLVEARLPRIDNVLHLQTMMRLVGKEAPLKLKKKLESKALSLSDQFTLPNAQYMISSMAALGFSSKPLLSLCSNKIIEHLSGIPFNRLLTVLVSCKELRFRDLQLLNAVSEYGASMVHVWNPKQLVLLLSSLESLSFRPQSLLDSFSELVQSDPRALTLKDLLCVLKVCSSLTYCSPSLVSCLISAFEQYLQRMTPVQLLNAQHHLSVMGHFPPTLLHTLLQESTLQQLRDREAKFVQSQLDIVELCLRMDCPEVYERLSVSSTLSPGPAAPPAPLAPRLPSTRAEFSSALQTLMEDREDWDLMEGQLLQKHYFVDAVLTKRLSEKSSAVASSQSLAVLCVPPSAFCFGTSHPRGPLALKLRHLHLLGHLPLLVPEHEIVPLSEEQRVEFLRARIFPSEQRTKPTVTQEELDT